MSRTDVPFVDKNSERYILSRRVATILRHMRERWLFPDSEAAGSFEYRDGQYSIDQLNEGEWKAFDSENGFWGYPECYAWFRQTVTVPERFAGQPVVYEVLPHDREWRQCNPQLILFVNGVALQGMDENHSYALLLDCARGGETFEIAINAYTDAWEWKGPVRMRAALRTLDPLARQLYYDMATPLEVANLHEADDMTRVKLVRALNEACSLLEMSDETDSAAFGRSAREAIALLDREIYSQPNWDVTASCIGHTHIDVAWLWRVRQTRDKAGRSFLTVLKLMEEYPEYRFMSPQAQLYEFVKQDYPEIYERIKERVAGGQWEAEGSMWVESDTNVVSGESLVRQFLVGKRFFKQEFGVENKIMWLPDVFGYTGALPQIIRKAGIDYFMTTKISWNEFNQLPFDTFEWQGIDGTKVLSHFSPSRDCLQGRVPSFFTTYNTELSPNQVMGGWKRYSNKDLNNEFLVSFGWGDGGGGPTVDMLEHGRRMARGVEGCPVVKQQPSLQFFQDLEKQVSGNPHLPTWRGELYLEFHRGVLTAQARNKRYNRKSELLYHDAETLAALALRLTGAAYPSESLLENWKRILMNQFHDIIPGSSIFEVYEDSQQEYIALMEAGEGMAQAAEQALAAQIEGEGVVVFNTLGFSRDDLVFLDQPAAQENLAVYDTDGTRLPSQVTADGRLCFLAKDVPSKGWKRFFLASHDASGNSESIIKIMNRVVETPALRVEFDENYNIAKLVHKATGRAVAPEGDLLNRLIAFEDRPNEHDAWNLDGYFREKSWTIDAVNSAEVIEHGPVRTVLRVVRPYLSSTIQQDFIFYPHGERIDIDYTVDWHEKHIVLKCDYPVDVNAARATFDIQFGNIERTAHENSTWDFAQFEVCGQKWADLSDNSFGLSVLNDCKYGWTAKHGHLMPTLLRCATDPNHAQDREIHRFTYAVYPHAGHVSQSGVVREGFGLNVPLRALVSQGGAANRAPLPAAYSFIQASADNIVIETVKKAEDSEALVIRCYETWNRRTETAFSFGGQLASAFECDLMEENDVPLAFEGSELKLSFQPFEIKTLKVVIA
ncbi:MAG: glycosyl hydrolase-related protein [Oscillospiraceae bacterium]|nr:glycosyl hydrolase-related protein [Oscillospiraceae bacterium]